MNPIQAYFKSDKLPRWFKFLNLSILLPILLWPLIFFTTIFFFDNPSNFTITFMLFIIVNAFPLYLIILVLINAKLYTWNKLFGLILPFLIIASIGFGTIYVGYNMIKNIAKGEQVVIERVNRGDLGHGFVKKNNLIYLNDTIVDGADANSFEIISWDWEKDKYFYYYFGKPVLEIDYETFKFLDYHYAKDKNHVFYDNKIIQGADAKTFYHLQGTQDGRDAKDCFRWGKKVDCSELLKQE